MSDSANPLNIQSITARPAVCVNEFAENETNERKKNRKLIFRMANNSNEIWTTQKYDLCLDVRHYKSAIFCRGLKFISFGCVCKWESMHCSRYSVHCPHRVGIRLAWCVSRDLAKCWLLSRSALKGANVPHSMGFSLIMSSSGMFVLLFIHFCVCRFLRSKSISSESANWSIGHFGGNWPRTLKTELASEFSFTWRVPFTISWARSFS